MSNTKIVEQVTQSINQNKGKTLIIILHYQSNEDTCACLSSLMDMHDSSFDIVIINNGMGKDIKTLISRDFSAVRCICLEKNMGFAVANNVGLQASLQEGYEFSLILNNDVVVDPHFLGTLRGVLEADEKNGLIGPAIYYYDQKESLWAMGGLLNMWKASAWGNANVDISRCPPYFDVDYLPGTCILVRNQVLEKVGLLPENYFLAFEEVEFALNAKQNGYKVLACRDSIIYHKVGMSSQRPPKYLYNSMRNRFLFLKRNLAWPFNSIAVLFLFLTMMLRGDYPRRLILWAITDHLKSDVIRREDLIRIEKSCKNLLTACY